MNRTRPLRLLLAVAAASLLTACTSRVGTPAVPEFVDHVERPSEQPLFEMTVDGVTAEAFSIGSCGVLVISVPEFGEFAEELCDPPESGTSGIGGVDCAEVVDDRCTYQIQPFLLGATARDASAVCRVTGDPAHPGEVIAASDGWFLIANGTLGGDVFPLDDSGNRLDDPRVTEIDDQVAEACGLRPAT